MIGKRIREKRTDRKMSLQGLADLTGLTPSFLSQVERSVAEPSITSLRKIADALGVPIFYFLMQPDDESPVVRRGERKTLNFRESQLSYQLLVPDLNRQMEVMMATLEPGASTCETALTHPGEECTVVLRGKMEITVGEEIYVLNRGDSIYFYCAIPHRITSVGEKDLVFISAITPPQF